MKNEMSTSPKYRTYRTCEYETSRCRLL